MLNVSVLQNPEETTLPIFVVLRHQNLKRLAMQALAKTPFGIKTRTFYGLG